VNVTVFLAGIADPKWPVAGISIDIFADRAKNRMALSPFDEAALEIALKIRDGKSETKVTIAMPGGPESDALLRKIAAYRPDRVARIDAQGQHPFDAREHATQLAALANELEAATDMILIGREFGDCDAGALPPCLAATLGWPFFGLAQFAHWEEGRLFFIRELSSGIEETLELNEPLVVSVTNDRRNKLRYPLMKNVMETKRMNFAPMASPSGVQPRVSLSALTPAPERSRNVACRLFSAAPEVQVAELAAFLTPWKVRS
jgi:electron transfer flavoprotein beta subunit